MGKLKGKALVAQSGGPTTVINSSLCGVIQECMKTPEIEAVYGAHNGILGVSFTWHLNLLREHMT